MAVHDLQLHWMWRVVAAAVSSHSDSMPKEEAAEAARSLEAARWATNPLPFPPHPHFLRPQLGNRRSTPPVARLETAAQQQANTQLEATLRHAAEQQDSSGAAAERQRGELERAEVRVVTFYHSPHPTTSPGSRYAQVGFAFSFSQRAAAVVPGGQCEIVRLEKEMRERCVKCITLEPDGVTIFNSIALIHPARTGLSSNAASGSRWSGSTPSSSRRCGWSAPGGARARPCKGASLCTLLCT